MKKKMAILLVMCFLIGAFSISTNAVDSETINMSDEIIADDSILTSVDYVPYEIVLITNYYVDLTQYEGEGPFDFNGVSITDIEPLFDATTEEEIAARIERMGYTFSYIITIDESVEINEAVDTLNNCDKIQCAETNDIILFNDNSTFTSDNSNVTASLYSVSSTVSQWAHTYLAMTSVWNKGFSGSSNVKVAVLDGGFNPNDDLDDNLNMSLAFDTVNSTTDVSSSSMHGTIVSSIIGADYNDNVGINGICKNVTIIPIQIAKSYSDTSYGSVGVLTLAFEDAIDRGADIINLSYQISADTNGYWLTLRTLINNSKTLFITTAGNEGLDMSDPDALGTTAKLHDDPYWIVVGSITSNDNIAFDSNFSSDYCDIFAPGYAIETGLDDPITVSGTSFAAPHVTAACALIMSHATHLSALEVRDYVLNNVKSINGFEEKCVSGGTLSILNIVNKLYSEYRGAYSKGDINGDGYVNATDYTLAKEIYFGTLTPSTKQADACDVNNSGDIDMMDYILIQRFHNDTFYFTPY